MPPNESAARLPRHESLDEAWRDRDFLSDNDYTRLASLIQGHTGIKLPPAKRVMLDGRLRRRVRARGHECVAEYCRFLFEDKGLDDELIHLIDVVTTNKTDFFREPDHFRILEEFIIPTCLSERSAGSMPLLKIWSAACSIGAEPYSIAMLLSDIATRRRDFRFSILGTDISTSVLECASIGIYPEDLVEPIPEAMQRRYLMTSRDKAAREYRVVPELRQRVSFQRLNLMDECYPFDMDVHVIFLRNVLIYFEKQTQAEVVRRLAGHLRPGGFIILGHSESMIGTGLGMKQIATGVFQNA